MRVRSYRDAFNDHKYGAMKRGIEFKFTFEEWYNWWKSELGPDWFKLRGNKKGQYVMARHKDVGPYEGDNVSCILHTDNVKISHKLKPRPDKLPSVGRKLDVTKVRAIFQMKGSNYEIARAYNIDEGMVRLIKKKQRWSSCLADLSPP